MNLSSFRTVNDHRLCWFVPVQTLLSFVTDFVYTTLEQSHHSYHPSPTLTVHCPLRFRFYYSEESHHINVATCLRCG